MTGQGEAGDRRPRVRVTGAVVRAMARRVALVGVLLGMGGLVGACAPEPEPTVERSLVWLDGEPDGPLERDPWVQATRRAELVRALAAATADLSDPDLSSLWAEPYVRDFAESARATIAGSFAEVLLGPQPFTPVEVVVATDGLAAEVMGCADPVDKLESPVALPWPVTEASSPFVYSMRDVDGTRQITRADVADDVGRGYCDGVVIHHGALDPAPDLHGLMAKGPDAFVPPVGVTEAP